ncbi:MAG: hypothetical protein ACE5JB_04350 [bacterium]
MRKITLAVPRGATDIPIARDTLERAWESVVSRGLNAEYLKVNSLPRSYARNILVLSYLKKVSGDDGYFLFVDSDMMLHPHTAITLHDRMERQPEIAILSAAYFQRNINAPFPSFFKDCGNTVMTEFGNDEKEFKLNSEVLEDFYAAYPEILNSSQAYYCYPKIKDHTCLFEMDRVGAGCLMVRRGVFEKIKHPWFSFDEYGIGEDFDFCRKAKAHGFKIFVDLAVMCGHVTNYTVTHRDCMRWGYYLRLQNPNANGRLQLRKANGV